VRKLSIIIIGLFVLGLQSKAHAQAWSTLLPASRATDWSNPGVAGGIPNRILICATINAATYGNGTINATSAIQSALNTCTAGQVVLLTAGNFWITSLDIPSNVTLRGAGAQGTILVEHGGPGGYAVGMGPYGSTPNAASSVNITSGATQGSTSFVVSSASGMSVGKYILVTDLNEATLGGLNYVATQSDGNMNCNWCDNSMWGSTRVRGQIVEITSVSGTTIGFSPALYTAYPSTPFATPFTASVKNAGVEDLQVYAGDHGYQTNFQITMSANCWIKGVEGNYSDGDQVNLQFAYRGEVRDNYFNNGFVHTGGTVDDEVLLAGKTSVSLVENNIMERLHGSVIVEWGAAGNVIAYNYSTGSFDSNATNVVTIDFDAHGAHPQFNLVEGNITPHIFFDSFWGTGAFNTFYRNWNVGTTLIATPYTGRGTINWGSAHLADEQPRGISMSYTQTRNNIIGDVAGSAANTSVVTSLFNSGPSECTSCRVAPGARSYANIAYLWDIGYDNGGDTDGSGVPAGWPAVAYNTTIFHAIFDTAKAATIFDVHCVALSAPCSHTLPTSLYLASRPPWWSATIPFPGIGFDVTGGIDVGGHVYGNPAKVCYDATLRGADGIKLFDRATCYDSPNGPPAGRTKVISG
jgi:hypothetical protein